MISKKNGLSKFERLHSRKQLDAVFANGKSFRHGPLKLIYLEVPFENTPAPSSFVFTVSKRQFKRAHDRNYIKRLLREVYRVNKHALNEHLLKEGKAMHGCFIFLGLKKPNYLSLNKNMVNILAQLIPSENEVDQSTN